MWAGVFGSIHRRYGLCGLWSRAADSYRPLCATLLELQRTTHLSTAGCFAASFAMHLACLALLALLVARVSDRWTGLLAFALAAVDSTAGETTMWLGGRCELLGPCSRSSGRTPFSKRAALERRGLVGSSRRALRQRPWLRPLRRRAASRCHSSGGLSMRAPTQYAGRPSWCRSERSRWPSLCAGSSWATRSARMCGATSLPAPSTTCTRRRAPRRCSSGATAYPCRSRASSPRLVSW